MATFRVGQRVRIIYAEESKSLIGLEATVVCFTNTAWSGTQLRFYHGYELDKMNIHGVAFVARPEWIEPLYDGHQTVEWSECLWQPTKEPA